MGSNRFAGFGVDSGEFAQDLMPQRCGTCALPQPAPLGSDGHAGAPGGHSRRLPWRPAVQLCAALGCGGTTGGFCAFWKHARHSTGRPWVGLNGTVVSAPHAEHVVRVSGRTRCGPRARFALHCLQCLGSFLNCLSWKKTCSPAVNTNSAPQSAHFSTRSWNSMVGRLPRQGTSTEIGQRNTCRSRFPVSFVIQIRARTAYKEAV